MHIDHCGPSNPAFLLLKNLNLTYNTPIGLDRRKKSMTVTIKLSFTSRGLSYSRNKLSGLYDPIDPPNKIIRDD